MLNIIKKNISKLLSKACKTQNSKLEITFKDRIPLTNEEFYNKYYKDKGIPYKVVNGVKQTLETELDADLSRLSAKDDFSKNLSFFWDYDSLADVELVLSLEKLFSIKFEDSEAEKMHTIDDIIFAVTDKLNQK